jgi:hypothetical protein
LFLAALVLVTIQHHATFFAKPNRLSISFEEALPKTHCPFVRASRLCVCVYRQDERSAATQRQQQTIADQRLILKVLHPLTCASAELLKITLFT